MYVWIVSSESQDYLDNIQQEDAKSSEWKRVKKKWNFYQSLHIAWIFPIVNMNCISNVRESILPAIQETIIFERKLIPKSIKWSV